jgi:acyl CoA:acetate/3-ketoacid CoA transferase
VYEPALAGNFRSQRQPEQAEPLTGIRRVIANRAKEELFPGACVNFGFGASAGVAELLSELGRDGDYWMTVEQGPHGGAMVNGTHFGMSLNPAVIVSSSAQFDFYSGGGLDITFLGLAQADARGNVNVAHLNGMLNGPGGFIDISQNARKVVFCGAFTAKGARLETGSGRLTITQEGSIRKLVNKVEETTFSGEEALRRGQEVIYVTERCVFRLTEAGMLLTEIAPGIDLENDILAQMDFEPIIHQPARMKEDYFQQ